MKPPSQRAMTRARLVLAKLAKCANDAERIEWIAANIDMACSEARIETAKEAMAIVGGKQKIAI